MATIEVYLEGGKKRVFANAVEWPGWARSARDDAGALEALASYRDRYAEAMRAARIRFSSSGDLHVVERIAGNATTDFGAPSVATDTDARAIVANERRRLIRILDACWAAFDRAAEAAEGARLRTGPRGGGRARGAIVAHVVEAETAYLPRLATRPPKIGDPWASREEVREIVRQAFVRATIEGLPTAGPRGGKIWLPRYFVRRVAWHALDHTWEIEDRAG